MHNLLEEEISSQNLHITSSNRGGVFFRTNSWRSLETFLVSTRYTSQVGVLVASWEVEDYNHLYENACRYPWETLFAGEFSFQIDSRTKDQLPNSRYSLYRLKDGILDRFRLLNLPIPNPVQKNPDLVLFLRSFRKHAVVEILFTNESLTKRGYRTQAGSASLRENIAQALLGFSGWNRMDLEAYNESILIDPFCGQGTILIEAAIWHENEGRLHQNKLESSFFFRKFKNVFCKSIDDSQNQSSEIKTVCPIFLGMDISKEAIDLAKQNAKNAGVHTRILWQGTSFENLKMILDSEEIPNRSKIFIITDPPYGKRLGTGEEAKKTFENFGKVLRNLGREVQLTLITGDSSLLGQLRLQKESEMSLKNAGIPSKIVNYKIYRKV